MAEAAAFLPTAEHPASALTFADGATVDGVAVAPDVAIGRAACLLADSRAAVIAGMGADVDGARAAIRLARAIGGSIDHMDAAAMFADLDTMRSNGWIVTTPLQARSRADTVLLVGPGLHDADARWMLERLSLGTPPSLAPGASRRVLHLSAGTRGPWPGAVAVDSVGDAVLPTLAALRALSAGRRTSLQTAEARPLQALAATLAAAKYGVAIWSAAAIDPLSIEMLCGLIDDLNRTTRFAGLPLPAGNGAAAVLQAMAWETGLPPRTGFAGGAPQHDPWRFDAERLIASGEADVALWLSAFSPSAPPWGDAVPTIALVRQGMVMDKPPSVTIEIGCPGIDHDAMLFDPSLGGIALARASSPRPLPRAADVIGAILAALPAC